MLSKELEFTLNNAFKEAREKRYEFMTVEHLLLALLDNPTAAQVLRSCGGELESLRVELVEFIDENTPLLDDTDNRETQPTLGFQRVLQRSTCSTSKTLPVLTWLTISRTASQKYLMKTKVSSKISPMKQVWKRVRQKSRHSTSSLPI